ncbi:MAG: hypothetical protein DME70_03140 [Verrucomicrobia bacterium]|nr:MAG: hypothetical protein DME70_03140 [Verrucomicrobiota bacterium]
MLPNRRAALQIGGIVCFHFDRAAISEKPEMMSCFLVGKSHGYIAALVDFGAMIVGAHQRAVIN